MPSLFTILGLAGVALIIAAYLLLQMNKLDARSLAYSLLNALGAAAIAVSLLFDWNLSAFVFEVFWLIISIYGIIMSLRRRRHRQ